MDGRLLRFYLIYFISDTDRTKAECSDLLAVVKSFIYSMDLYSTLSY